MLKKEGQADFAQTALLRFNYLFMRTSYVRYHYPIYEDEGCEKAGYVAIFIVYNNWKLTMEADFFNFGHKRI